MRRIAAGEFKAKCLKIMDEVAATGEPVLVTKRGKPVVSVTVAESESQPKIDVDSIFGCMRGMVSIVGDPDDFVGPIFPIDEWDHLKGDSDPSQPK